MSIINSIMATVRFELMRVMTFHRICVAVVMMLFPPVMMWILEKSGANPAPEFGIAVLCGMVCFLSLLLWATSNVYTELEGKSWTFVTSRPYGRWSILFGKYLISFVWSFLISWVSLSLCMLIQMSAPYITGESKFTIWFCLSMMLFLASMVYSAIFSLLGVVIQRRAMVFAVGYFAVIEVVFAAIPAMVGKIAMSFHMLSLTSKWIGWIGPDERSGAEFANIWGEYPAWVHLSSIFAMTLLTLGSAAFIIRIREYITLEDAQI